MLRKRRCVSPELALRLVIFGGEALELQSLRPWFDRHGDQQPQLVNMYGITETTVHVTYRPVDVSDLENASNSVIGRAIPDLQLYVLDAYQQPVPIGVAGEVYVGGRGLARGYLNRPELTAERFIANPFGNSAEERLYRTGDLARYLANGDLDYLGRIDHQVQLRGFRIELGEVEALLNQHAAVAESTVIVREDQPGDQRMVAYIVPADAGSVSTQDLRETLRKHLPEYMVPSAFVMLESLPLTANGKVDRRALPAPDFTGQTQADSYIAPRTETEEKVCGLFADVLGCERVGVTDHFFDLGGHSLLATKLIARIRETFQVDLPLRTLFEEATPEMLAEKVEEACGQSGLSAPALVPVNRDGALPLSFSQQRLWFLDQLEPGHASYNMPAALRLTGVLDVAALQKSFQGVIERHESLRTSLQEINGEPMQVIAEQCPIALPILDLQSAADPEAEMMRLALEEANRPFDLRQAPLMRTTLLRLGAEDHVLLVTMHHIISDAWSIGVFVSEFTALYAAALTGEQAVLAPLPVQFADYAVWQREMAARRCAGDATVVLEKTTWRRTACLGIANGPQRDGRGDRCTRR